MEEKRKTTQELFSELMDRLMFDLKENEIVCPTCKGLRLTYRQEGDKGYIGNCTDCYNGKLYICKHCGKANKTDYCSCKDSQEERNRKFSQEQSKKERELFEKAKKIKFNDYKGYFSIDEGFVKDSDSIYDWLYEQIKYENLTDDELPKYLWAMQPEPVFSLDLKDIINDKCEEGYEDMYNCLNTDDDDLVKAQEYLDKWYQKQGDSVNVYYEDHKVAVLLDDLIKEIRENIKKEGK